MDNGIQIEMNSQIASLMVAWVLNHTFMDNTSESTQQSIQQNMYKEEAVVLDRNFIKELIALTKSIHQGLVVCAKAIKETSVTTQKMINLLESRLNPPNQSSSEQSNRIPQEAKPEEFQLYIDDQQEKVVKHFLLNSSEWSSLSPQTRDLILADFDRRRQIWSSLSQISQQSGLPYVEFLNEEGINRHLKAQSKISEEESKKLRLDSRLKMLIFYTETNRVIKGQQKS